MTSGPCTPWVTAADLPCVGDSSPVDDRAATAAHLASDLLYAWSGRQFAGTIDGVGACRSRARPGTPRCGCWPQHSWWYASELGWDGWSWGGRSCGFSTSIRLPGYPVSSIESVTISGDTIDPASYELREKRLLVRVDGLAWPSCQDQAAAAGSPGTVEVVYRHGAAPPLAGVEAAKALACELYNALTDEACALPSGVTRVVRQGVTIDRVAGAFQSGKRPVTGLPIVDAFLDAYNPGGHRRRPSVWTPDLPTATRG